MSEAKNDLKHIAVLAFPFATHAPPLFSLIRRLSTMAPQAKFSFFSTRESNNKIFSNQGRMESIKPYNVNDGLPEDYMISFANPHERVEYFLKAVPGNFKQAMEVAVQVIGREITCIISDAFFWFGADIAHELHVPWVPLWTAGPRPLLLHLETDLVRQKMGGDGVPEDRTMDFLPGFSEIRAADIPKELLHEDAIPGIPAMLYKMGKMLPRAAAGVLSSWEKLDPDVVNQLQSRLHNFLEVGPLVLTSPDPVVSDPQCCLEWLDKQKRGSVLYVCFGSMIMPPPHELAELAEALEECDSPFLWSFRENPEAKLPEGFLERTKEKGKVVSWSPQLKVLQHNATGVFLTHAGWNSISESIVGCVPMICRPFFGDQALNTRTVEAIWKIGVGIEGGTITKDGVTKAIKLILSTEEGEQMRKNVEYLQDLALDAVSNGGSSKNFEALLEVVTK
ncbi:hypothetical protein NC653_039870 [Populus alba x Populus x berolinensis]|uniref:Glycosyltransferase n=2 Tax=Populus alba x Populus x berolinensis TaxID=444605 RepID=A0AAD6LCV7_9ROSI|nr:hypothetical protein NC653_039870 [Populus alba x Populus x berolinensis]